MLIVLLSWFLLPMSEVLLPTPSLRIPCHACAITPVASLEPVRAEVDWSQRERWR